MEACLPTIRADLLVCDSYHYRAEPPLDCPLTVLGGSQDPLVTATELAGWSRQTTSTCTLHIFEGDHFFVRESAPAVLHTIHRVLANTPAQLVPAA
jgi:surfactin synthase thioesterase subunit